METVTIDIETKSDRDIIDLFENLKGYVENCKYHK